MEGRGGEGETLRVNLLHADAGLIRRLPPAK